MALARRPGRVTRRLLLAAAAWASVTAAQALRGQSVIRPDLATDLVRADLRVMALARLVRVADGRPVTVPSYELEEQLRGEFDLHGLRSLQLHRYRCRGWQDRVPLLARIAVERPGR